jgi:hypothetical protein
MFQTERLRFVACAIPLVLAVVVGIQVATHRGGATRFGPGLGADYPAFYGAGRILLVGPGSELYDLERQSRIAAESRPGLPPQGALYFVHPPFTALPFLPLARLPFAASYLAWIAVSVVIIAVGLFGLRGGLTDLCRSDWITAAGLTFASAPLLMESIIGGQIAVIAFGSVAAALTLVRRQRMFLAGMALAILSYKPTLLILIGPLLVLGRRWRTLAGLAMGGLVLIGISVLVAGPEGCRSWVELMTLYGRLSREAGSTFRLVKFIDLTSSLHLGLGESRLIPGITLALALPPIAWLACTWIRKRTGDEASLWAATLTWTLVLNVHVAIYDVSVALPGLLITLDTMARRHFGRLILTGWDRAILAFAWCLPWFYLPIADRLHLNLMTPALAFLAVWQQLQGVQPQPPSDGPNA